uniref:Putative rna-directed dna polymerase from mobile element jockey n=1 Tax=Xenopsylla cheopis TaxID=163159 RepID=A0A6M2DYL3_XENCH
MELLLGTCSSVILAGDLNARHPVWQTKYNYTTLAHTHFPDNPLQMPSTIDLVITRNVQIKNAPYTVTSTNSDHNPVIITIMHNNSLNITPLNRLFYNYKNANWKDFRNHLNINTKLDIKLNTLPSELISDIKAKIASEGNGN